MKIIVWTVSVTLALIVAGLAFVFFSPDYDLNIVRSESMKPSINIGDVIISGPVGDGSSIKPGVIVTYKLDDKLVTHRVLSVDGNTLITKGDANEDPDLRQVQLSQVKGRYLFRIPYLGYVSSFVHTRLGWWLVITLPAVILITLLIKDILKKTFSDDERCKEGKDADVIE